VSEEMRSSQVVLGRPFERLQERSEDVHACAADSEDDVGCWNITTESGDVLEKVPR